MSKGAAKDRYKKRKIAEAKASGMCIQCKREPAMPGCMRCDGCRAKRREISRRYKDTYNDNTRLRRLEYKRLVIEYYGGRCVCCGEVVPEFLTVDHINGGGAAHRREIGDRKSVV